MTTPIVPKLPTAIPVDTQNQTLDEGRWQAWLQKGRAHDARSAELQGKAVQWGAILTLVAAAIAAPEVAPYPVMVRGIVSVAAIALLVQAARAGQYTSGAALGVVALLHNPFFPVFGFSSALDRVLLLVSTVPFLVWKGSRGKAR